MALTAGGSIRPSLFEALSKMASHGGEDSNTRVEAAEEIARKVADCMDSVMENMPSRLSFHVCLGLSAVQEALKATNPEPVIVAVTQWEDLPDLSPECVAMGQEHLEEAIRGVLCVLRTLLCCRIQVAIASDHSKEYRAWISARFPDAPKTQAWLCLVRRKILERGIPFIREAEHRVCEALAKHNSCINACYHVAAL